MRRWPVYDHVIFDFDSTLSAIEGIDVLAARAGVAGKVSELTRRAMDGKVELESVYEKRLSAIHPTRGEIRALKEQYKKHMTEDAELVIAALLHLGHEVYIVSGGLLDPIVEIGSTIGVPKQNIRAVDVEYDLFAGDWWLLQTDREQPALGPGKGELDKTHGKAGVILELLADKKGKSLLVGDGASDLEASPAVDLFLGFAGVAARKRVVEGAPVVLRSNSLAAVVVVAAGAAADRKLEGTRFEPLVERAIELIDADMLQFNDEHLANVFFSAFESMRGKGDSIFD